MDNPVNVIRTQCKDCGKYFTANEENDLTRNRLCRKDYLFRQKLNIL